MDPDQEALEAPVLSKVDLNVCLRLEPVVLNGCHHLEPVQGRKDRLSKPSHLDQQVLVVLEPRNRVSSQDLLVLVLLNKVKRQGHKRLLNKANNLDPLVLELLNRASNQDSLHPEVNQGQWVQELLNRVSNPGQVHLNKANLDLAHLNKANRKCDLALLSKVSNPDQVHLNKVNLGPVHLNKVSLDPVLLNKANNPGHNSNSKCVLGLLSSSRCDRVPHSNNKCDRVPLNSKCVPEPPNSRCAPEPLNSRCAPAPHSNRCALEHLKVNPRDPVLPNRCVLVPPGNRKCAQGLPDNKAHLGPVLPNKVTPSPPCWEVACRPSVAPQNPPVVFSKDSSKGQDSVQSQASLNVFVCLFAAI